MPEMLPNLPSKAEVLKGSIMYCLNKHGELRVRDLCEMIPKTNRTDVSEVLLTLLRENKVGRTPNDSPSDKFIYHLPRPTLAVDNAPAAPTPLERAAFIYGYNGLGELVPTAKLIEPAFSEAQHHGRKGFVYLRIYGPQPKPETDWAQQYTAKRGFDIKAVRQYLTAELVLFCQRGHKDAWGVNLKASDLAHYLAWFPEAALDAGIANPQSQGGK